MPTSTEPKPDPRRPAGAAAALGLVLLCTGAHAQTDDVPLPPRIDRVERVDSSSRPTPEPIAAETRRVIAAEAESRPGRAPKAARLAPLPDDRRDAPDEIVVIGDAQWRLPDLGSWRAEQLAEERARMRVSFLHLYPVENDPTSRNPFLLDSEQQRFGEIQVVRWRFGHRSKN